MLIDMHHDGLTDRFKTLELLAEEFIDERMLTDAGEVIARGGKIRFTIESKARIVQFSVRLPRKKHPKERSDGHT